MIDTYIIDNWKVKELPFLRSCLTEGGLSKEEIDEIEKKCIEDPAYIEVLKGLKFD